jgi:hypothetical protein
MGKDEYSVEQLRKLNQDSQKLKKPYIRSTRGLRKIGKSAYYFKSTWEANYARYLEWLKDKEIIAEWFYEPQTFWYLNIKRGVRSYLPDFKVISKKGTHHFVEVKGYMDAKSKTKIKRFKKYYPDERLEIVDGEWFKANKNIRLMIPAWE